ncbi:MAG: hypothetical protein J6T74_01835 [Clostridia bacterium]|nr:hypothetical protein [Clostridia bacterium]
MQNSNIPFYTVGLSDLLNALSNPDAWNKVMEEARKSQPWCTKKQETPAKETPKEETNMSEPTEPDTNTNDSTIGSIFDEDSLTQAIRQYENEINDANAAHQKVIDDMNAKINLLKARLVKEQMKTRVTRQGNDMAVTMVVENARKVADALNNILNQENVPDKITINIPDVG